MRNLILGAMTLLLCLPSWAMAQTDTTATAPAEGQTAALAAEYFGQQEYAKAAELYAQLASDPAQVKQIHFNYLECLLKLGDVRGAEKYLKRQIKRSGGDPLFSVDLAMVEDRQDGQPGLGKAPTKRLEDLLAALKGDNSRLRMMAQHCLRHQYYDWAEQAYRQMEKNGDQMGYELAELYDQAGQPENMIAEYLKMVREDDYQLEAVQNQFSDRMADEEDFALLEKSLYRAVQRHPGTLAYNEMLVWLYLQRKDFKKAFFQARAIDKRKRLGGYRTLEIGRLAMNNEAYDAAILIFNYVVKESKNSRREAIYSLARRLLINAKEELVKNTYPVDLDKIRSLAADYRLIVADMGLNQNTGEALRSLARLQAFYLGEIDSAITQLQLLAQARGLRPSLINRAKIDLADVYLLDGQPWESTLLYSQVEKAEDNRTLGHQAKLKNAKLSFYQGDFELAKGHLDVLKLATTREIANDAMDLSLLIQDNLGLDTTDLPLKRYAAIDLLVFQSQYDSALQAYEQLQTELGKDHSLTDEILWAEANIFYKLGQFEKALNAYESILKDHADDLYGDDANYFVGLLYEEQFGKPDKAMEYYQRQLLEYPGSIYIVDARKRFRRLRGDKL